MSIQTEELAVKVPSTYQDWLVCFDVMKNGSASDSDVYEMTYEGSFVGSDFTKSALQKQIVETVNAILDRSIKRFIRRLNEKLVFNELSQTELLFKQLKKDVNKSLFFTRLTFLPKKFRSELENTVKKQMIVFWNDTIKLLHDQSLEYTYSELDDVLFLVKRIRLF